MCVHLYICLHIYILFIFPCQNKKHLRICIWLYLFMQLSVSMAVVLKQDQPPAQHKHLTKAE